MQAPSVSADPSAWVFHARDPRLAHSPRQRVLARWLPGLAALLLLGTVGGALFLVAHHAPGGWRAVWTVLNKEPWEWIGLLLQMSVAIVAVWLVAALPRRARLVLTDHALHYSAGLPSLARWLDWQIDLNAVRAGAIRLQWAGDPLGNRPEAMYRLTWGAGGLRGFRPAAWYLPGQPEPVRQAPHAILGLVRWASAQNQAILQRNLQALPLVRALRARDVVVPPITGGRQIAGLDLLDYPRVKVIVWAFFGLLGLGAVLFHVLRHQHFFVPPGIAVLATLGAAAAMTAGLWMAPERERADKPAGSLSELRLAKLLVAVLLGVAMALCSPLLALGWGVLAKQGRQVAFAREPGPEPRLKALDGVSLVPDLVPREARDFWFSLSPAEPIALTVRRGTSGWWWQYDSAPLADRVQAFYENRPASKAR